MSILRDAHHIYISGGDFTAVEHHYHGRRGEFARAG